MSVQDRIAKGQAAKELMESPTYILAIDTVRIDAFRTITTSKPEEKQAREDAYYLLLATSKLKENLDALVANASFEEAKLRNSEALKTEDQNQKD